MRCSLSPHNNFHIINPVSIFIVLLCLLALSCNRAKNMQGEPINFKYASNISITKCDGYWQVRLDNPWQKGTVLHNYTLISHEDSAKMSKANIPSGSTVVYIPLRRSVVMNTAHASLIHMLDNGSNNLVERIAGVADAKYMQLPYIHEGMAKGRIADCGNSMSPDYERIVDIGADAVLLSPFENSGGYGKLETLGIPIIECAEYMETSALGRAEWMLFYGLLFGGYEECVSLFDSICSEYSNWKAIATKSGPGLSMLTEKLTSGTWYIAGGKSTVSQLITDAGGSYCWSSDNHSGSIPMSFERVLDESGDADVWIFNSTTPDMSYDKLYSEYHGYSQLKSFRNHNVWCVNSLKVPYFEEVSFRPDLLLRDYVIMLHPYAKDLGTTRYFKKLYE